jgi:hypothetical protein
MRNKWFDNDETDFRNWPIATRMTMRHVGGGNGHHQNRLVFVHASLMKEHADWERTPYAKASNILPSVSRKNDVDDSKDTGEVAIEASRGPGPSYLPVWGRFFADAEKSGYWQKGVDFFENFETEACEELMTSLDALQAGTLVVGHTPMSHDGIAFGACSRTSRTRGVFNLNLGTRAAKHTAKLFGIDTTHGRGMRLTPGSLGEGRFNPDWRPRILHVSAGEHGQPPNFRAVAVEGSGEADLALRDTDFGATYRFDDLLAKAESKPHAEVFKELIGISRPLTSWIPGLPGDTDEVEPKEEDELAKIKREIEQMSKN